MLTATDKCLVRTHQLKRKRFRNFFFCATTVHIGPRVPQFEVSRSHTIRHRHTHTHSAGFLQNSDWLIKGAATYTTHNQHKTWTSLPSAGSKPTIPGIEQPQTHGSDCTATRIGAENVCVTLKESRIMHATEMRHLEGRGKKLTKS